MKTRHATNDFVIIRATHDTPGLVVTASDDERFARAVIDRVIEASPKANYAPDAAERVLAQWRAWHDAREAVTP